MLSATLTAAHRRFASSRRQVKKIEPQTTGLMTARTVTIACNIW